MDADHHVGQQQSESVVFAMTGFNSVLLEERGSSRHIEVGAVRSDGYRTQKRKSLREAQLVLPIKQQRRFNDATVMAPWIQVTVVLQDWIVRNRIQNGPPG